MIKKKKNPCKHWTSGIILVILCALCFNRSFIPELLASTKQAEPEKRRFPALSQTAEAGTDHRLRQEQEETQRQMQQMNRSYAELLLENKSLLEEITVLRLQVANLMGKGREDSAERRQERVLAGMLEMNRQHANLYRQIDEFGDYLQDILQVIQPSQALRQEIEQRYAELSQSVARLEHLPSIVAWRGGDPVRARDEARILKIDNELQLVILDAGENEQVRSGSQWRVSDGSDSPIARIRVLETRSTVSAAIPIEGSLDRIIPGMKVEEDPIRQ